MTVHNTGSEYWVRDPDVTLKEEKKTMPAASRKSLLIVAATVLAVAIFAQPVSSFTAESLTVTVDAGGDATAVFLYSLEGIVENSIPESLLEEELKKGLTTSSEPPEVVSFSKSRAILLLPQFALASDTGTGTEYVTASMDFSKAEIALQNSALSYVITADFSPQVTTVTFPDGYEKVYTDSSTLPSISHTVIDPDKMAATELAAATGTLRVNTTPSGATVSLGARYLGESPGLYAGIAPGQYTVTLGREGYDTAERTVIVEAGRNTTVIVTLVPEAFPDTTGAGSPAGTPGFTAALGVCALAAAGVFISRRK